MLTVPPPSEARLILDYNKQNIGVAGQHDVIRTVGGESPQSKFIACQIGRRMLRKFLLDDWESRLCAVRMEF